MSLTNEQRAAVDARGKVIVSASAGSGKTHVMIERFVELLREGKANVRELLAVTFTNKAAAQMRDRARRKLLAAYRETKGEDRERLKRQLDDLPLADISTIHAFCGRLVRSWFFLVGVDPRFRIASQDDAEGRALAGRALESAFERAYAEGGDWFGLLLTAYFRKKKDKKLRDIVLGLYSKIRDRSDYKELLQTFASRGEHVPNLDGFESVDDFLRHDGFDADEAAAQGEFGRILKEIEEDVKFRAESIAKRASKLRPFLTEHAPKALPYLSAVAGNAATIAENEGGMFAIMRLLEDMPPIPRSPAKRETFAPETVYSIGEAQALAAELKALCAEIGEGSADWKEEFLRFFNGRRHASALARLTLIFDEEYAALKKEGGVLDYSDLEHLALEILKNDEARAAVRGKYRYLFVDEYQDVNPMQSALLDALAGDEIFLVGDKKQAIYGFRGSRTQYFSDKERAFGAALPLNFNFRSAPVVLEAVNRVFGAALPAYSEMIASERYRDYPGEVLVHSLDETEKETAERGVYSVLGANLKDGESPLARKVLSLVREECGVRERSGREWFDADEGKFRRMTYGDIAVLVRKNTGAAGAIVRELSEHGIPVTASAEVNVCDYFEARLLIDWLSYLDNPEQDIPLCSALLSSIGGFTDRELALIRLNTDNQNKPPFREACRAYSKHAKGPLADKLNAFFARAEGYRKMSRVRTATEIMELLLADGLEAQIAAKGDGKNRLARVRRLVQESRDCSSIHDFLKRLKDSDFEVEFSESGGEGAVKVLTLHASKGLEYPVVILTELDNTFHGTERDEVMWTDEFFLSPKSFDVERKVYYETVARRAAELSMRRQQLEGELNLLYVAMTRARCRLHMIFDEWKAAPCPDAPAAAYAPHNARRLSDFLPKSRLDEFAVSSEAEEEGAVERHALVYRPNAETVRALERAGEPYRHAASTNVPVKSSATDLMRRMEAEEESTVFGGGSSAEEGTAYHAFLEHVTFGADAEVELARMQREGILSGEQISLLDKERLKAILKIPCLAALAGKRTLREQKFLVTFSVAEFEEAFHVKAEDDVIFQGAIDLLVEDSEGWTIIDYKHSGKTKEEIARHYAVQMKLYRKTVAKILRIAEESVRVRIVNIAQGWDIPM